MFPIGDDDSALRSTPVVTYGLIAINVLVFLLELRAGAKERGVEGEPDPQALPNQPDAPAEEEEESFGNGAGTLLNPCCNRNGLPDGVKNN